MNKRVLLYSIVLVWVAVLLQLVVTVGIRSDNKIVEAFQASNSMPVKSALTVTGIYDSYLVSYEEQEKLLKYIAEGLSLENYQITKKDGAAITSANRWSKTDISIAESGKKQQIVTTDIELTDRLSALINLKETCEKIYRKLNMEGKCSISMEGVYHGNLSAAQIDDMKTTVFKVLEAKEQDKQKISGSNVYYGYSKRLDTFQAVDGKKINTQLIFSYNEKNDRTEMYLAVPFFQKDF